MTNSFSTSEFIKRLSTRLVTEFDDAHQAGTPGLKGSAREHPARKQLEKLLPGTVEIGSGLVIDSYGNVSKQQDIIVYEKIARPIFSINDNPESTYYPCEGVIAVGEVKSTLNTKELQDSFQKMQSVKSLKRYAEPSASLGGELTVPFRLYGDVTGISGTKEEEFDQNLKSSDQIYGFVLCGSIGLKIDTFLDKAAELYKQNSLINCPDIIASLKDGFMQPCNTNGPLLVRSVIDNSSITFIEGELGFSQLVRQLTRAVKNGRTVGYSAFSRYLSSSGLGKKDQFLVDRKYCRELNICDEEDSY